MLLYIFVFVIIVFAYINSKHNPRSTAQLKIVLSALAIFVGISDMLGGYDRYIYGGLFDKVADITDAGGNYLYSSLFINYPTEFGYGAWNILVSFITANRYIFILLTTFLIYILLYRAIRDYTNNYMFAVIIFMGLMFFFTFTYLRQIIAAVIAWQSIRYIISRDFKRFALIMFIAFSFHNSSLIFFPLYFLPLKRMRATSTIPLMIACLLLGVSGLPATIFDIYGATVNEERAVGLAEWANTGFRIAYFIEAIFFMAIILYNYSKIPNTPRHNLMLNISIIFCCILLIFVMSENGGRLSWPFMIGLIATLSYIATAAKQNSSMASFLIVICFALYLRIVIGWDYMISPYKTFFTDGVREGDRIEQRFEYDQKYKTDKFYR